MHSDIPSRSHCHLSWVLQMKGWEGEDGWKVDSYGHLIIDFHQPIYKFIITLKIIHQTSATRVEFLLHFYSIYHISSDNIFQNPSVGGLSRLVFKVYFEGERNAARLNLQHAKWTCVIKVAHVLCHTLRLAFENKLWHESTSILSSANSPL